MGQPLSLLLMLYVIYRTTSSGDVQEDGQVHLYVDEQGRYRFIKHADEEVVH